MEVVELKKINRSIITVIITVLLVSISFNVMTEKLPEISKLGVPTVRADDPFPAPQDKYVLIGYVRDDANIGPYLGNWFMLFYNEVIHKVKIVWNLDEKGLTDFPDVSWAGISFRMYYYHGNHENDRDQYKIVEYHTEVQPNIWEDHGVRTRDANIDWNQDVYWEVEGVVGGNHFTPSEQHAFDIWTVIESALIGVLVGLTVVGAGLAGPLGAIAVGFLAAIAFGAYKMWQKQWLIDNGKWDKYGVCLGKLKMKINKDYYLTLNVDYQETGTAGLTENEDTYNLYEQSKGRPYDTETYIIDIRGRTISKIRITFECDESKIHGCGFGGPMPNQMGNFWTAQYNIGKYEVDLTTWNTNNIMIHYVESDTDGVPELAFSIWPVVDFEIYDNIVQQPGEENRILKQDWDTVVKAYSLQYSSSPDIKNQAAEIYVRFDFTPNWGGGTGIFLILGLKNGNCKLIIGQLIYWILNHTGRDPDPPPPPGDGYYWDMYEAIWDSKPESTIILPNLPELAAEPVVPEPNCEPAFDPAFGIPRNFEIRFAPDDSDNSYTIDTEKFYIPEPACQPAFDVKVELPDGTATITISNAYSTEPTVAINSQHRSAIIIPGKNSEGQIVRVNNPDNVAKVNVCGGTVYNKMIVDLIDPDEAVYIDIAAETETEVTVLESSSSPKVPSPAEIVVCISVGSSFTTYVDYYSGLYINPEVKIAEGTLTTTPSASYTTFTDLLTLSLAIDKSDDPPSLSLDETTFGTPLIDIALEIYGNHLKPLYWVDKSTLAWECEYEHYIPSNPPDPTELTTTFIISGYSLYPEFNSIYWGLSNTGSKPDTINLEVGNVPTGWSATLKDDSGTPVSSVSLSAGQTVPLYLEVTAPQTAQPREIKYIWVKSSSSADSTEWDYVAFKVVIVNRESVIWWPDLTLPSNAHSSLSLVFPWGGGDEIAYLKLPKTGDIRFSSIDITGDEVNSNYPTDVRIDIGNDGTNEWIYEGELSVSETIDDLLFVRYRIISNAIQDYIDSHQPNDSQGYIYVPIKISSETEGMITISNINILYRYKWTTGIFSLIHDRHPGCYYWKYDAELYYTGPGGVDIDDALCPYIDYSTTIDENDWEIPALIRHYYYDEDQNGIIDGTTIPESTLIMYWWDENLQGWVPAGNIYGEENTGVDGVDNFVWANVDHFSYFTAKGSYVPVVETENLIETLDGMHIAKGMKNSLRVKLETTLEYLNTAHHHFVNWDLTLGNENLTLARNKLNDFINEVEAQKGKMISEEDAYILISGAEEIITLIEEAYV